MINLEVGRLYEIKNGKKAMITRAQAAMPPEVIILEGYLIGKNGDPEHTMEWYSNGRAKSPYNDFDVIGLWAHKPDRKYYHRSDIQKALERSMINCDLKVTKQEFVKGEFFACLEHEAIKNKYPPAELS